MSLPTPLHMLRLPRELRDEIYTHFLKEPDGYAHVPRTNKLRCSDGRAIGSFAHVHLQGDRGGDARYAAQSQHNRVQPYLAEEEKGGDEWAGWSAAGRYDFMLERLWFVREEIFAVAASAYGG